MPTRKDHTMSFSRRDQNAVSSDVADDEERRPLLAHGHAADYRTAYSRIPSTHNDAGQSNVVLDGRSPLPDDRNSATDPSAPNGDANGNNAAHTPREYLIDTDPMRFRIIFVGYMLAIFIAIFDSTIMASSHPVITAEFHSANSASWLTTAYMLTSIAFSSFTGRLSDAVGRRPIYVASIALFGIATIWCALARSMTSLLVARAVCGIGGGGMMSMGNVSVIDSVDDARRGPWQSWNNIVYGIAAASGAAFGGVLADTLGWRWEFGVQALPIALCLAVAYFGMPADLGLAKGAERKPLGKILKEFDFKGSILLVMSITFLILGLNLGGNVLPWSHPFIITSLALFGVCFPTFLYVESIVKERPVMPLQFLHTSPRANMIFANFFASFLINAVLFNVPIFFRGVLLTTATESGLYLLVPTITAAVVGAATGYLIKWTGRIKWPIVLGTSSFLIGTTLLSTMQHGWPLWTYLVFLVPAAAGQGFQMSGTNLALQRCSDENTEKAVASTTLGVWRSLGNVLGVAGSSLVLQNSLLMYLRKFITPIPQDGKDGEEWKRDITGRMRSSIEAVGKLPDGQTKNEVMMSYEAACRVTFLLCVGIASISLLLAVAIKVPRLKRSANNNEDVYRW
ncbi:major facilitator superfamily domain-containing protein [Xylariaceae sp. FL1272]|nr:major facilitator superfamily domain-containing protein [Xylariaceae sp. FL1272]